MCCVSFVLFGTFKRIAINCPEVANSAHRSTLVKDKLRTWAAKSATLCHNEVVIGCVARLELSILLGMDCMGESNALIGCHPLEAE